MEKLVALLGRHCRRRFSGAPTGERPAPLQVAGPGHAPAPATRDGGCRRCRGIDTCNEIVTPQYVPSTEEQPAITISNPARAGSAGPQFELRLARAAADIEDTCRTGPDIEAKPLTFDIEGLVFDIVHISISGILLRYRT
jgi:hypothetical protein